MGTLSVFYPYFEDLHLDWPAVLPGALVEAAGARSPLDTQIALKHLVARLRDNHARVTHRSTPTTGILPLMFRKFGDQIIVTGGLPQYTSEIAIGSELIELDGESARNAYQRAADQSSVATEGMRAYLAPLRMSLGVPGSLHRLRIRDRGRQITEHVLPMVVRDLHTHDNREPRPASGSELAPGIYYVDLESLSKDTWAKLVPSLERARAIVLDARAYPTITGLEVLSHLSTRRLHSARLQIPQITSTDGVKYVIGGWDIHPQEPTFHAKLVGLIDGRAMSAMETWIQFFHEARLGVLVGETSGGTNGDTGTFELPGGFEVRCTTVRVPSDGSTVQGRGFAPDRVVHPSLAGVLAGRDEILEAGVAEAQRLIQP